MKKLSISVYILFSVLSVQAENAKLTFDNYTTNPGLSSSHVYAITQDKFGFMWFGTDEGLNRYDGTNFKHYRHGRNTNNGLNSSWINALYAARDGKIWVGTEKGVCIYDPDKESLRLCQKECDTKQRLTTQRIKTIYETSDGIMWLGTTTGLIKYDTSAEHIDLYTFSHENHPNKILNEISSICEDSRHNLWIGTFHGLYCFNPDDNSYKWYEARSQGMDIQWNNLIKDIKRYPDQPETLYLATSSGLVIMSTDGTIIKSFNTRNSGLCDNDLRSIMRYDDTTLLLGTSNGLATYDINNDSFQTYTNVITDQTSLVGMSIRSIFEDNSGNIWIATLKGLSKLDKFRKPIDIYRIREYSSHKETNTGINDIDVRPNGNRWLATDNGIIVCDTAMNYIKTYSVKDGLSHPMIKRLLTDSHGTLWVGTNDGIDYYDPWSDSFVKASGVNSDIIVKYVYDIKEDKNHDIIVNISSGICFITPDYDAKGRIRKVAFKAVSIDNEIVSENCDIPYFDVAPNGDIWIGTGSSGVVKYNKENGSFQIFDEADGLISNRIYTIHATQSGDIWIGTDLGLCVITAENSKIKRYETDPYLSQSIRSVCSDESGRLWVTTSDKLIMFDTLSGTRIVSSLSSMFGIKDMVHNSLYNDGSHIYLGGDGCVIRFNPEKITINNYAPNVIISEIRIADDSHSESSNATIRTQKSITITDKLHLNYKQNDIAIYFTMPTYSSSQDNRYMYKLDNYDSEWHYTDGGYNSAHYSKLPYGKYTFCVKGCNPDGIWNEQTTRLEFTITPPWWCSTVAYIIYSMMIIALIMVFARITSTRIKLNTQLRLEKFEREKIEKLNETKMQFFTNMSHELKTPLSLIIGPTESLIDETNDERQLKQLSIIRQNGQKLSELVSQIMDLRKLDANQTSLNLEHGDFVGYLHRLFDNFKLQAEQKGICYEFESGIEAMDMSFDGEKIERVIYNILSNAFKFTPDNGAISVKISTIVSNNRTFAEVRISDTGCGIKQEEVAHIFDRFYQGSNSFNANSSIKGSGIGLVLVKDYVELHDGEVSATSEYGKGTSIRLTIACDLKAPNTIVERETEEVAEARKETKTPLNGSKTKIVVIEDNEDMLSFLKMNLEPKYDVYTAKNGEDGYGLIVAIYPDLIISDLMMPGIDGFEVCRRIKQDILTCHIPVILLTAKSDDSSKREGYECGADDYIAKPFGVRSLLTRVDTLIDMRRRIRQSFKQQLLTEPSDIMLNSPTDRLIDTLVRIVEDNISDPEFGIQQLCDQAKYPYQQIYRKIKAFTGESINEFIRDIRLKRAAQYLSQSDLRVSEIIYKVGFNSHSYFTKCFREYFGISPTEYIARNAQFRNNNEDRAKNG